jgi:hypothetical protein
MTFLPVFSDDELSAEAAEVAVALVSRQGHPLSNFQRILLGHVESFTAFEQLGVLADAIAPFLGERAVKLFSWAYCEAAASDYWTAHFRRVLLDAGENLDNTQVTETEQLMIDWARLIAKDPRAIPAAVYQRVEVAFTPRHRLAMLAYAGELAAAIVVADVARLPAD